MIIENDLNGKTGRGRPMTEYMTQITKDVE